ncbi:MAG: hypothetical protein EXR78_09065 [Deltaproteobacteria bacterium]|nr:hypothetical protein [Deltaproteobacteria bacterium]
MPTERERQTSYGAINPLTQPAHRPERPVGDGGSRGASLRGCHPLSPDPTFLFPWAGARDHRGQERPSFLAREQAGVTEADWKITSLRVAPTAPEQNPVDALWLKGQTSLRKQFAVNNTFAAVTHCCPAVLRALRFESIKCRWYGPDPPMIWESSSRSLLTIECA